MSPPTGRVLALLELLQTIPGATATELAGRLSVDERTVRRDAAHLCALGIPVRARRGRHGGFHLAPRDRGHRLAPLILTEAEAVAILLGLGTALHTGVSTGARGAAATASAMAKLRRILPESLTAGAAAILETLGLGGPDYDAASTAPRLPVLLSLATAASQRMAVTLRYEGIDYVIVPTSVSFAGDRWIVTEGDGCGAVQDRVFDLALIEELHLGTLRGE